MSSTGLKNARPEYKRPWQNGYKSDKQGRTVVSIDSKRTGKINRRSDILKAAEKLMRSHGLSGVTTRQISKEVGCSEGALYVHFKGRLELLLAMLEESLPDMLGPLETLRASVGRGSPHTNLVRALRAMFKFHRRILPATCGLFAEPELSSLIGDLWRAKGRDLTFRWRYSRITLLVSRSWHVSIRV